MKHLRMMAAAWLFAVAILLPVSAIAAQNTYVLPTTGPMSPSAFAAAINQSLISLASCHSGTTAPANGPGAAPTPFQCWMDTSSSPTVVLRYFDGAQWAGLASLNTAAHSFVFSTSQTVTTKIGSSYPLADADRGALIVFTNSGAVAVSLSQANTGGGFTSAWYVDLKYSGSVAATITPTISTIDGAPSLVLRPGQGVRLISDGTNYFTAAAPSQIWNANLQAISGLTPAADKCQYWTGTTSVELMDCLAWSRSVISAGSIAAGRAAFGLTIGGDIQAWSSNLDAFSLKTAPSGAVVGTSDSQVLTNKTLTAPAINSPTGIVKGDIGLGNVDNTSDATKNAAVATLTNKTLTAPAINSPTGIVKSDVGLGNVDNTSDATKNAAAVTLTNKTLTAPVINSPTGIVKGDIGLGNVDNTSDATKNAAAATLANKTLAAPVVTGLADVQGATKRTGISSPSQITSNQNDYNPGSVICSTADTLILSSDASRDVTGLAGGVSGCEVLLVNSGSNPIVLKDSAAGSTAGNRFATGADITLAASQAARFVYQAGSTNKWRYIGVPGSGGGGGSGTVTSVACAEGALCSTITSSGIVKTTYARHFMMGGL